MNFDQAEAQIRKHFDTQWSGLTAIAWPDLPFDKPDDETWVRFDARENDGFQNTIGDPGNNAFRHTGIVTIQVFQPQGQASKDARDKAQKAIEAFQGMDVNGIHFFNVQARQVGNDRGWYQINVLASFRYDEIT
jgi:hypothetical protein